MLTLGIDTALKACSVALIRDGEVLSYESEPLEKGHAERLPQMTLASLDIAGVRASELDRIGVVIGPGAFAGVRVGVAFARGLALGTNLSAVGIDTLKALALGVDVGVDDCIAAIVDARRGQLYAALYRSGKSLIAPFVAAPDEVARRLIETAGDAAVVLAGDGADLLAPLGRDWRITAARQVDPRVVARFAAAAETTEEPPAPLYLRAPDATPAGRAHFDRFMDASRKE